MISWAESPNASHTFANSFTYPNVTSRWVLETSLTISAASGLDILRIVGVNRPKNAAAREVASGVIPPMICGKETSSSRAFHSKVRSGQNATSTRQSSPSNRLATSLVVPTFTVDLRTTSGGAM